MVNNILNKASAIIFISEWTKKRFFQDLNHKADDTKVSVIYSSVNKKKFNSNSFFKTKLNKLYDRNNDGRCSRIIDVKLSSQTIILIEGHYTLRNDLDKFIDFNILLLSSQKELLKRKINRVGEYRNEEKTKKYFFLLDIPSFINHLERNLFKTDLIIENTNYKKPIIKKTDYGEKWIKKNNNYFISKNLKNSQLLEKELKILFPERFINKFNLTSNLNNIILIATKDAVMAANLNKSESIKTITGFLNKQKRIELVEHPIANRPWGYYENIISEKNYKVKKLFIYPGKKISLQEHKKRSEHWIVISGKARVTRDGKVFYLLKNQSTYIPKLTKHRLENNTRKPLIIIEVQTGSYFGEDDIKRFDDEYGRK